MDKYNIASSKRRRSIIGDREYEELREVDVDAWNTLSKSLKSAQALLDQNHKLIKKVNENHMSKVPDNMVKNVQLIRDINDNISKVVGIYSELSQSLSNIVREAKANKNLKEADAVYGGNKEEED